MTALRALRRYARPRPPAGAACELCRAAVASDHRHVVDLEDRALRCACRACALAFEAPGAARGRYRTVPDRVRADPASDLTDADWSRLGLPVRLAFLFFHSRAGRWVAFYPGPAGAVESEPLPSACEELARRNRLLAAARPDVEAVLAFADRGEHTFRTYLVPIAACYELVGRVRRSFRGFDGGDDVRRELLGFFAGLRDRAEPLEEGGAG